MLVQWLAWIFAIGYACLQGFYLYQWIRIPPFKSKDNFTDSQGVSIIIVARNESAKIQACIRAILSQLTDGMFGEVIIIDDHSTDEMPQIINEITHKKVRYVRLQDHPQYIHAPAYKKSGITLGVDLAQYDTIIVTDADCIPGEKWLTTTLQAFRDTNSVFQAGPVLLTHTDSLLEKMQEAEQLTFTLIAGAGIHSGWHDIASGANMIFTKEAFKKVNGYDGNFHFASGDDMFLIEKMRSSFPGSISFIKSIQASVYTTGKKNWQDLLSQRMRWAGKNKGLKKPTISNIWSFVGLYHMLLFLLLITSIFSLTPWQPFLILLIGKWLADYFVLNNAASFFKRAELVRLFVTLQMLYFWYVIRLSLAMASGKKGDWERRA